MSIYNPTLQGSFQTLFFPYLDLVPQILSPEPPQKKKKLRDGNL